MSQGRIKKHPILPIEEKKEIDFLFNNQKMVGSQGEVISSALIANGIDIFGHHPKDGAPQGIFCANGQCAQCLVIVNGVPRKACMVELEEGMEIQSCEGLPKLPMFMSVPEISDIETIEHDVLIVGAGPAGLSAAIELGNRNVDTLLIDDKAKLGGKLLLQTHKFFGSIEDCYAGTRGIDIASILQEEVERLESVKVWTDSTAIAVFSDHKIGVLKDKEYKLIVPKKLLFSTGAREKMLHFPGNTLPGVYGAGAFQTLVNRDLVKPCRRLFIIGGGNVGLIAGYHALQAGMDVVGLVEALPKCGGYKVHEDKLKRLGVPIYTSHTLLSANGKDRVKSITITQIDEKFKPIKGTERTFEVDTILIAVGLSPVDELYRTAKEFGFDVYSAGDAQEIAEASSAMFSGRIAARKILGSLGIEGEDIPVEWEQKAEVLKSPPGKTIDKEKPAEESGVVPIFHCVQEIPCNPCISVCPQEAIFIEDGTLTGLPVFSEGVECKGCMKCVAVCPGLAISLVDYRKDKEFPKVILPFEVSDEHIERGVGIIVTDQNGEELERAPVEKVVKLKDNKRTRLVIVKLHKDIAKKAISIRIQKPRVSEPSELYHTDLLPDDAIICRCERITAREIRDWIRKGIRDMNQLKAITRAGMGACGAKTCKELIYRLFREEGISFDKITEGVSRPLFIEVSLGTFANVRDGDGGA